MALETVEFGSEASTSLAVASASTSLVVDSVSEFGSEASTSLAVASASASLVVDSVSEFGSEASTSLAVASASARFDRQQWVDLARTIAYNEGRTSHRALMSVSHLLLVISTVRDFLRDSRLFDRTEGATNKLWLAQIENAVTESSTRPAPCRRSTNRRVRRVLQALVDETRWRAQPLMSGGLREDLVLVLVGRHHSTPRSERRSMGYRARRGAGLLVSAELGPFVDAVAMVAYGAVLEVQQSR